MRARKTIARLALLLCVAQLLLILVSWLLTAAMPDVAMRSLLSSEGIRWFFAHFAENIASPLLVWLLLLSIAYGAVKGSGLSSLLIPHSSFHTPHSTLHYRQRFALRLVLFELVLFVVVIILLTAVPHAVLLSVTGSLFPSSFSQSLIPILAFALTVMGISYGVLSGAQETLADIFDMLTAGIAAAAPLFLIFLLGSQLYFSVLYVFI